MTESLRGNFPLTKNAVSISKTDTEATSKNLALTIAEAALDRKAVEIILLDVAEVSYLSDYFVMMTGYSKVQVRAIAEAIEGQVEIDWQRRPLRTEGKAEGTWVLQDYGDVIVHIMMPREREFYNLEAFWGHAERIFIPNSHGTGG
ncbi:ribosome silencing factor [Aphanizomenon flos-aquae NRERC-008]|jgi:ribosome-associated protein|uniref:Ribosomal silencing factor RsfS n=3 Tax=Aphanizomenon flos-aquae TaxID=1176 RepID=A0A1B7WNY8_APHFL|nr:MULTISPECIES: ribosome silencing factor [Aphanizomenon]MBD1217419.1 ribosome silencing factor [Aphanizomenon flos-aquae Clear-A1]MBO1044584.1 ribosome silencing factor [Aphanizomenon flos-aquae UKL13-PB]MCE2906376.1 ribosome silencing factor [Anabaena sp. CoA2_C59]MDJ0506256.1 ribosome silencing factor [Nostocales cyanobacterium LE14-WE12]NTW21452.1 ribosome silencing factor [Nostocales cyanobacterium W4_Combined_metabat2_030]OBQ18986.1 MAG: ribosome silencing factor [Aphanizomenon flos-aq